MDQSDERALMFLLLKLNCKMLYLFTILALKQNLPTTNVLLLKYTVRPGITDVTIQHPVKIIGRFICI